MEEGALTRSITLERRLFSEDARGSKIKKGGIRRKEKRKRKGGRG
jgi:hypothetical protein